MINALLFGVKTCIQIVPLDGYFNNKDMVAVIKKYKNDILAFGHIDLCSYFNTTKPQYAYDHEIYFPSYKRANDLSIPILFHTGNLGNNPNHSQRFTSQIKIRSMTLGTVGRAFPKLKMIMGHLGHPKYTVGLDITYLFKKIYTELLGNIGSKWRETELRKAFTTTWSKHVCPP